MGSDTTICPPPWCQAAPLLADGSVGLKRTRGSAGAVLAGRLWWVVARGKSRRHGHDLLADGHDRQGSCWLPSEVLSVTNHHIRHQASREVRRPGLRVRGNQAVRVPDLANGHGFARAFHLATVVPLPCQGSRRAVKSGPLLAKRHGSSRVSRQGASDGKDYSCEIELGVEKIPVAAPTRGGIPGVETAPDQAGDLVPVLRDPIHLAYHLYEINNPVGRAMQSPADVNQRPDRESRPRTDETPAPASSELARRYYCVC